MKERLSTKEKYGIRYSLSDHHDPGERCFDAIGKTAAIGIGALPGHSDFDGLMPWAGITRVPIPSADGEDIFVKIPLFSYDHYREDGYEYFVIAPGGERPHPAFVEDGRVLDAIYISAYEATEQGRKLYSRAGRIPANNTTPADFLAAARQRGKNYTLYDLRTASALWLLMAVEYGRRNTNTYLGYGAADFLQPIYDVRYRSLKTERQVNCITVPAFSNFDRHCIPIGSTVTLCQKEQRNILTMAKLLSYTDDAEKKTMTLCFDGPAVDVDEDTFIGSGPLPCGASEVGPRALAWHTGRSDFFEGSILHNAVQYRGIENPFSNVWHFLPDVRFVNGQLYAADSMKQYTFSAETPIPDGYRAISAPFEINLSNGNKADIPDANYWVSEPDDEAADAGLLLGRAYDKSLLSKDAFGAFYYVGDRLRFAVNGGGFDHCYRCNSMTTRFWQKPDAQWYLYGARLQYKEL